MSTHAEFIHLIESNLSDLQMKELVGLNGETVIGIYSQVLLHYRQGNLDGLEGVILRLEMLAKVSPEYRIPHQLAIARLQIRKRSITESVLHQNEKLLAHAEIWEGEISFVLALAYELKGDHKTSQSYYQRSARAFETVGCPRKALKSLFNAVAAESRINPKKKLLSDYHLIYRRAKDLGEVSVAGIALVNISREYQLLGALSAALKYVNDAVDLLNAEFGSIQYDLAIAHRCHVLFEMGRSVEAQVSYDYAIASSFPEVRAALEVVDRLREKNKALSPTSESSLLPTWKERMEIGASLKLTKLEEMLISLLGLGAKDKYELIQGLYGDRIALEAAENRLNNLLNRVRKKLPDLIENDDGKYYLTDESFLDRVSAGA